jgi:hypothetical protein
MSAFGGKVDLPEQAVNQAREQGAAGVPFRTASLREPVHVEELRSMDLYERPHVDLRGKAKSGQLRDR